MIRDIDQVYAEEYRSALFDYVVGRVREPALMRAYELGRLAVEKGNGILEISALNQKEMLKLMMESGGETCSADYLARGEAFLAEVLAPFEMMYRGYADTIRKLQDMNKILERRVNERTRELQESEQRTAGIARLYSILSGINSTIVREHDMGLLFREACHIAVERGGFKIAWVGQRSEVDVVHLSAWCSEKQLDEESDRQVAEETLAQISEPMAAVLESKQPVVGMLTDKHYLEGRENVFYQAYALLPLLLNDKVAAVLALFSDDRAMFDTREMRLLKELAGDLSFALEYIENEKKLQYFAYYDTLTGLPNDSLLMERLAQRIQDAEKEGIQVAVLLVDLVRFSNINDTYGRDFGDQLLRYVGRRLRDATDRQDTVARIGADVFGLLLTNVEDAGQVAYKLESDVLSSFTKPFLINNNEVFLDVRVGIALYPVDATEAEVLYKNAEIALKRAQKEGVTYIDYNPAMNEQIVNTVKLETKLRRALERNELRVYYQPKIAADSEQIVGMEALVRYVDPDYGLVSPTEFVPMLEETGMIIEVGNWVMRRAEEDSNRWRNEGLEPPRISVNVSPLQLRHKDFLSSLAQVAGGLKNGDMMLDIEITESAVMEEVELNIPKLQAARDMGFQIAVDDFGTGYSSLSYLSRLPVNALKIDRSFIVTMADSPNSLAIVTSIISLAHSLGLEVIAEGVEQEDQAKLLRLLRCEQIQGNLFCQAMPPEEITGLLERRKMQ